MSSFSVPEPPAIKNRPSVNARDAYRRSQSSASATTADAARDPITVLIVVPTLDGGAADAGALELVRVLENAGHHAIVASRAGRLVADVTAAGAEFVPLDVGTNNPIVMLRNAGALNRLARARQCDAIHAFGRAGAWSALIAARLCAIPFVTSWYKGFREQNVLKRLYNSVMARGTMVVAVSDEIAQLINDRYGTPWQRIAVVPCSIEFERFDPRNVTSERIKAVRQAWGVTSDTKVILITGRILRRKGHHVVVKAIRRLKDMRLKNLGAKDFLCVFIGEDRGRTHYTGELWDLVLATGTMDVIRIAPVTDMPAAYAAACVVVSGAIQPEGVQRAILEAQAMARPVIVSDLAAGADVVLAAPGVPEGRCTGMRFNAGDDAALAAALLRLISLEEPARNAIGLRGRDWVLGQFNAAGVAAQTLRLYDEIAGRDKAPDLVPHVRQN
jgi:glycosyltransferase involved in cell wall biosynthesis